MELSIYGQDEIYQIIEWHEQRRIDKLLKKSKQTDLIKEWYFLTINPAPNINLTDFHKTIEKAVSKVWITTYLYVIEQRGENIEELGKGFHTHIIFNKGIKHCKVISEMKNTFKNMCDCSRDQLFNLKNIGEEEKTRKIEYITGIKKDDAKHLKQEMDIIFRKENKLKSYYILEQLKDAT